MEDKYSDFNRDQLLERIKELESQLIGNTDDDIELKHKNKKRKTTEKRPFDMSKYTQRKIALRVAYLGWNYCGYASQSRPEEIPTIEDMLFKALLKCRLIEDIEASDYSRCGRTDKGVSGLGQVIALNVRSKKLQSDPSPDLLPPDQEFPYIDNLNRMLPPDIRVLAWAPVPDDFSARFHCTARTYKYFFARNKLQIDKMQQACTYFEGHHDFRNFCKMDPSKNVLSYERHIISMKIDPVEHTQTAGISEGSEFYQVTLKGTAFLWHQVRFMMSVLFLVGQGFEAPEVIRDLLDIDKVPSKPDFPMASDLPLVLYDCEFKDLNWTYSFRDTVYDPLPSSYRTYLHYSEEWTVQMIRSLTCQYYLTKVGEFPVKMEDQIVRTMRAFAEARGVMSPAGVATIVLGGGKESRLTKYKSLLERPRCDTDQVKKEKFEVRKKRKLDRAMLD
ncbi:pseudouridine synthase [Gilbertella persicaria]|uniref:pseudouridine synthase n=1 Tax=Gilbertella persicaria TaxID=101096 RepID=UPI00221E54D2|nr:pseudouridine synthase [Gilbertella persicaria]KAI8081934.1 pseudouridine synthase [Gilbertella persicaria]